MLIGGFFSSLRGATIEATPSNIVSQNNSLRPGDTLLLRGGVYTLQLFNGIGGWQWKSGTSTLPVTYKGYPGENVIIRPNPGSYRVMDFGQTSADQYIVVDGIVADAVNCQFNALKINSPAHHITFRNGEAKNGHENGIFIAKECPSNVISRVNIHHNGAAGHGHGLYISSSNNVVEYCDVHDNAAYGMQFFEQLVPQGVNGNIARFNKFWANGVSHKQSGALGLVSGSRNQAIGNTILSDPYCGIRVQYGGVSNAVVEGNNVVGGTLADIYIGSDSASATVKNNCASKVVNLSSSTMLSNNTPTGCSSAIVESPPPQDQIPVYTTQIQPSSQPPVSEPVSAGGELAGGFGTALTILAVGFLFVFLTD